MAKKEKIHLQYSDDLESVDAELASAMDLLDQANDRVDGLLKSIDIAIPAPGDLQEMVSPEPSTGGEPSEEPVQEPAEQAASDGPAE